jgi:hypothetical protein
VLKRTGAVFSPFAVLAVESAANNREVKPSAAETTVVSRLLKDRNGAP